MNDETLNQLRQDSSELLDYAYLDDTEVGEVARELASLCRYVSFMSTEFVDALAREVRDHLTNFEENTEIVEVTETRTHKVKQLNWL